VRKYRSVLYPNVASRHLLSLFLSSETSQNPVALAFAAVVWLRVWESLLLGAEDAIQFLHQGKELLSILLHCNQPAQLVNAVILNLVHSETGVLRIFTMRVCSMPNNV
jgi:hypothetical protein